MILKNNIKTYIGVLFGILILFYLLVEYKYDFEVLIFFSVLFSLLVIIDSIKFRIRRDKLIELGEREHFNNKYIGFLILILLLLFFYFVIPKMQELNFFPAKRENLNVNFSSVVMLPILIRFLLGIFFKEVGEYMYATEKGIIQSMETKEIYKWEDFNNYKIISDQNLFSFEKRNSKYLFISYEEKYFNKHKEEILRVLDQKLKK